MALTPDDGRRALEEEQRALNLANSDLNQTVAAVRALQADYEAEQQGELVDHDLRRALETAIVVCYARAFTANRGVRPLDSAHEPTDRALAALHRKLCWLRDKRYAHTDAESGRDASLEAQAETGFGDLRGVPATYWRNESWLPLECDFLDQIPKLARVQAQTFLHRAGEIGRLLEQLDEGLGT
jgi:hypothetical protein